MENKVLFNKISFHKAHIHVGKMKILLWSYLDLEVSVPTQEFKDQAYFSKTNIQRFG